MENLLFILAATWAFRLSPSTKTFKKYQIGNTGCSIFLFGNNCKFKKVLSPDGDTIHLSQCEESSGAFGVIAVQLKQPLSKLADADQVLSRFMKNLQPSFSVSHSTGLIKGQIMENCPGVIGMVDYWQDNKNVDWKVKGWTNGKSMAVLYVKNINEVPVQKQEVFLDGFRFS